MDTRHPGELAERRRNGEAAREHLPRRQHRPGQRAGDDVPPHGPRRVGSDRRRQDQAVRLHAVLSRARASAATASRSIRSTCRGRRKQYNFEARFIELAGVVNGAMPEFVVQRIIDALNSQKKSLNGSRVHVIGVAYKRDVNDLRESPALEVLELLAHRGATVSYTDPYVPEFKHAHLDLQERRREGDARGRRLRRDHHRPQGVRLPGDGAATSRCSSTRATR